MKTLPHILLVEDNIDAVELTLAAFRKAKQDIYIKVVIDGIEAMQYLRRSGKYASVSTPALVLLDLNLPRKDGREVLAEMKADPVLRSVPVVILSGVELDIVRSYDLHANCFISKPLNQGELEEVACSLHQFWFGVVRLPVRK